MKLKIYTTGGTIDKVYFDQKSTYEVGESKIGEILREANAGFAYVVEGVFKKDSLDITEQDRQVLFEKIRDDGYRNIVVTHGTDTMVSTAAVLDGIPGKTIVLTGAMEPARFRTSDARFNIGAAVTATQILPPGVYIIMNGQVLDPGKVRKNRALNKFEPL